MTNEEVFRLFGPNRQHDGRAPPPGYLCPVGRFKLYTRRNDLFAAAAALLSHRCRLATAASVWAGSRATHLAAALWAPRTATAV
jgi:hypothetical protein